MEFTGRIVDLARDYNTNKFRLTVEVNEDAVIQSGYDKVKDLPKLKVKVSKWSNKRSLDANSYFHVLVGKIADSLNPPISKAKAKNILICKYGQPQMLPDNSIMVYKTNAPEEFMLEQEALHCIPVKYEQDATFYKVYRGSHTYDTKEMSLLIDGTVQDAKDLGIETLTPTELERMKVAWK